MEDATTTVRLNPELVEHKRKVLEAQLEVATRYAEVKKATLGLFDAEMMNHFITDATPEEAVQIEAKLVAAGFKLDIALEQMSTAFADLSSYEVILNRAMHANYDVISVEEDPETKAMGAAYWSANMRRTGPDLRGDG